MLPNCQLLYQNVVVVSIKVFVSIAEFTKVHNANS